MWIWASNLTSLGLIYKMGRKLVPPHGIVMKNKGEGTLPRIVKVMNKWWVKGQEQEMGVWRSKESPPSLGPNLP